MKKNILVIVISCIISVASTCAIGQEQSTPTEYEARSIVSTYFDALVQGDTFTIKQLLGEKYLKKRKKALDNPSYANTLSKRYSLATSTIVGTEQLSQHQLAVDTLIQLNHDETLECRFIIAKNEKGEIKILEEVEHN